MGEGIGFITPRGEFFLPELLHLKPAHGEKPRSLDTSLNATAKAVYLHLLYARVGSTVSEMASRLALSRAGVQRACEDLLARGLAVRSVGGPTKRTALYEHTEIVEYYEAGWEAFGPAAKRVRTVPLEDARGLLACGLSALSERTMLNPPNVAEFAIYLKNEAQLGGDVVPEEGRSALVHVLPYDPAPFAQNGMVDPFTMLKTVNRRDERTDMAIDEVKEGMGWPI